MSRARSCVLLLLAASPALAAEPGESVEIWIRKPGDYASGRDAGRERLETVTLSRVPNEVVEGHDAQTDGVYQSWGISLAALLAIYAPPSTVDLALLHFANGTLVPLPFRDAKLMRRLSPFVARAMRANRQVHFSPGVFPHTSPRRESPADVRPLSYGGNRLVVRERWHPEVPIAALQYFSPWSQVDTLLGIELVDGAAWRRQFDIDAEAHAGFELFQQSCAFCHGARKVGASFGWDFVEPYPIYSDEWLHHFRSFDEDYEGRRDPQRVFYYHVKYRAADLGGRTMPALGYLSEADARAIWRWIESVAHATVAPYQPQ